MFLCQHSGVQLDREEEGQVRVRVWNPKAPFSGALLHCQQYSLRLEGLLSVHLCMFVIMWPHIYNVYMPLGLNRQVDAPGKLIVSPLNQYAFGVYYILLSCRRLTTLLQKRGKVDNWKVWSVSSHFLKQVSPTPTCTWQSK